MRTPLRTLLRRRFVRFLLALCGLSVLTGLVCLWAAPAAAGGLISGGLGLPAAYAMLRFQALWLELAMYGQVRRPPTPPPDPAEQKAQALKRWREHAKSGLAPDQPVGGYQIFEPEKLVGADGSIRFQTVGYVWNADKGNWTARGTITIISHPEQVVPAGTPVDVLADRWADFCRPVEEMNEKTFQAFVTDRYTKAQADAAKARDEQLRLEQVEESRRLAEMLPGTTKVERAPVASASASETGARIQAAFTDAAAAGTTTGRRHAK